jgi:[ribosomal protein S5]-alanine N-acetyltransferase
MAIDNFYEVLDRDIPGGKLGELNSNIVPNRNLYLTKVTMDGLEEMHEYSKDERLYKYFEFKPFKSIKETRQYLQKLIDRIGTAILDRKYMYWFIRTIKDNKIVGSIGLIDIELGRDSASWGYAIAPEVWGKGYILETQLIITNYFFDVLKMNRLWGITSTENGPTISSILSAGFQKEGVLRDYYKYADGRRGDGLIYSMLAKDYFSTKQQTAQSADNYKLSLDKLKTIFAALFGIPESVVNLETSMADVYQWDSLNHILLITRIEKETAHKFKPTEIAQAISVRSILDIINK